MFQHNHIKATIVRIWIAPFTLAWAALPAAAQNAAPPQESSAPASTELAAPPQSAAAPQSASAKSRTTELNAVQVTAKRFDLLGKASTASEGVVEDDELQLTPIYRPGQLLETVPGLVVTIHSGELKANQYLLRGYNLDHGTDLATFVDNVPVNEATHAHGQGYTDLNFLIPELADELTYTKGTYYPSIGDFGAVGSVHVSYRDTIPTQVTQSVGTFGFERLFAGTSYAVGGGNLLAATELEHYDGPFVVPDNVRKENFLLRYSRGDERNGYSVTGSYYHGVATNTTDIPDRSILEGLVANRFGSLDPTDGVRAQRANLSSQYHVGLGAGQLNASAYVFDNGLRLYNNFTHFLFDPINGDQEDQYEDRQTTGGEASYTLPVNLAAIDHSFAVGVLTRYDNLHVGRAPSIGRVPLPPGGDPPAFSNLDRVNLFEGAVYAQATTRWTPWFRSVLGFREDYQHGDDDDRLAKLHLGAPKPYTNSGKASRGLFQPKGSLIVTPTDNAEFYVSAGRGFHSADLRGVNQSRVADLNLPRSPLLASQVGEEIGARINAERNLSFTVAIFNLDQESETIIDPDVGQDAAGPPSRRYGFEVNTTYKINRYLEFYGSYSGDHTRFKSNFDDGTGHYGKFITDAPKATGSLDLYLKDLGPWSGGLEYRYLGNFALASGPCDNTALVNDFPISAATFNPQTACTQAAAVGLTRTDRVKGKGYGEFNLDGHYDFGHGWGTSLGIYNLLDIKAAAAQFYYVDRLKSEINTLPDGRADIHEHPLETISARLTISKVFGL